MPNTILLDTVTWDLAADLNGNIAMAGEPYAFAQDAASAIKVFQGEVYYDVNQGVPYFSSILGYSPPISLMKAKFKKAALTVPGVVKAKVFLSSISGRRVTGQVEIKDVNNTRSVAGF